VFCTERERERAWKNNRPAARARARATKTDPRDLATSGGCMQAKIRAYRDGNISSAAGIVAEINVRPLLDVEDWKWRNKILKK